MLQFLSSSMKTVFSSYIKKAVKKYSLLCENLPGQNSFWKNKMRASIFTAFLLQVSIFTFGQGVFGGKVDVLDPTGTSTFFNTNGQTCDGAGTGNLSSSNASAYSSFLGDKYYLGGNVLTYGFTTNYGAFMKWRYYVVGGTAPAYGAALNFGNNGATFTSGVCSNGTNIKIEYLANASSSFYIQCTTIGSYRLDIDLEGYNGSSPGVNYPQYVSGNYIPFTVSALNTPSSQAAVIDGTTGTSIDLSWKQDATPHNVMVVRSTSSSFTAPTQGTGYAVNATIGSGTVIFNGSGTSFTDAGLTPGQIYYYSFYSVNNNYYSSGVVTSGGLQFHPFQLQWRPRLIPPALQFQFLLLLP